MKRSRDGIKTYTLVDGQQRLITISVLLYALAASIENKNRKLYSEIRSYLVNVNRDADYRFKVLPTERYDDRKVWESLVTSGIIREGDSLIKDVYSHYSEKLKVEKLNARRLFETILKRLTFVSIFINRREKPHQIFESLNAKSVELTLADLVRNYIAMRLSERKQEEIFNKYWSDIENLLDDREGIGNTHLGELSYFLRHYMFCFSRKSGNKETAYADFRVRMNKFQGTRKFVTEIKTMHRYAGHYDRLLRPNKEEDNDIQSQLQRIKHLGHITTYPLLLHLYDEYALGRISKDTFIGNLKFLEIYLVRTFLANESTRNFGRLFPTLIKRVGDFSDPANLKSALAHLSPSNNRIKEVMQSHKIYSGAAQETLRFILSEINRKYVGDSVYTADQFKGLTIEHIMPKNLNRAWRKVLGKNARDIHDSSVNCLGNLTLVKRKLNTKMKDNPFADKRPKLVESDLYINRYFNSIDTWNKCEIQKRTKRLVNKALSDIWISLGPGRPNVDYEDKTLVGFKFLRETFLVRDWHGLTYQFTKKVAESVDNFTKIAAQFTEIRTKDSERLYPYKHEIPNTGLYFFLNFSESPNARAEYIHQLAEAAELKKNRDYRILLED